MKITPDNEQEEMAHTNNTTATTTEPEKSSIFSWKNVSLSVNLPSTKKGEKLITKQLLENVTGYVKAGEVIAIMGGSGAGKSTLLNTLAGRIATNTSLSGEILVDGHDRNPGSWQIKCAYVEQDDLLFKNLTVYETLLYSAKLRLPSSVSEAEKIKRVEEVIAQLGLQACRNSKIGDELKRGISGGERKRVSIGIELVTNPNILFLDEPTSGLDAFNAFNAIETIQKLAKDNGKLVLMTIHQPRTDILDLFDKIILLSLGKLLWFGSTNDAIAHFEKLGYPLPPKTNPSDFFLDTITIDRRTPELTAESSARIEKFHAAFQELNRAGESAVPVKISTAPTPLVWPCSWPEEFYTLTHRFLMNHLRDPTEYMAIVFQSLFLLGVMSLLYAQFQTTQAGIQNRLGFMFFVSLNTTFGVVMPSINHFPPIKRIVKRERAAGSYRSTSVFLAKVITSMPALFLTMIFLVVPSYWAVGLYPSASNFLTFLIILFVNASTANNLGLLIGGAIPNVTVGQIITPMVIILMMLFGGLLINLDSIQVWIRWLQWFSIISYTYKSLVQMEFLNTGLTFSCESGSSCITKSADVVSSYSLSIPGLWECVIINVAFGIFFLFLGMYVFDRTSAPMSKLNADIQAGAEEKDLK